MFLRIDKHCSRTPFKAEWLVFILTPDIRSTPNLSNKRCKIILTPYMKSKFMTNNLLQNARKLAKTKVFGDPNHNVQYAHALCAEMRTQGHDIIHVEKNAKEVRSVLEHLIVTDEAQKQKRNGVKMTAQDKKDYLMKWRNKHADLLNEGGMGAIPVGDPIPKFCSGIYVSPHFVKEALQFLHLTYQADACHLGFGKYTMMTVYGSSANNNTFPIAFGIVFGNETKEAWMDFWKFVKNCHPIINIPQITFITDQAKGLIESITSVLPNVGQLLCSYHRIQNIHKVVKGGSGRYSCAGVYNRCMQATNMAQLEQIRIDDSRFMSTNALKYLFSIPDKMQFPCARVGDNTDVYLYNRKSSSAAEGMNRVNKPARDRSAVDPVNSSLLLIEMMTDQFQRNRDLAWKCTTLLTPHGVKLRDDIFALVDYTKYNISVSSGEDRVTVKISRIGNIERECFFLNEEIMGSVFGGCTCGAPNVQGIPCHHMIAVVKSNRVEGLNPTNAMPCWYTTEMWRRQYPKNQNYSTISMNTLTSNHTPITTSKYCPPYAAPRKSGRPRGSSKRCKSPLEGKKKKGKVVTTEQQMIKAAKSLSKSNKLKG